MSRLAPRPECREVAFREPRPLAEAVRPALEDYARARTGASEAELLEDQGAVTGVHLCGALPGPDAVADLESFARDLAAAAPSLGWS